MKQTRLFTPGPTAVPPEVLETMSRPLIHHRTGAFRNAYREVIVNLQYIMRTENPVVVLTASGTGAMEAAVVNFTKPGDRALVAVNGKFSDRFARLTRAYGVDTVTVEARWGDPVAPEQIEQAFLDNPGINVLFAAHSETSTAVIQDVEKYAAIAHAHDALIVVDGITSVGAHDVFTDRWGLDVVIGGAQKGVMIPPGLAYASISERAVRKARSGRHACFYLDLLRAIESAENGDTPYTPAISLVLALRRSLRMIREEGIENVVARHAANAGAVRAAVTALGLDLLSTSPSNATTAVVPPEGTAAAIIGAMERDYGVKVAGGQMHLKDRILRLGHLGHYYSADMYAMIAALEGALADLGITEQTGEGLNALRWFYSQQDG